jgi:hypothetical protein
MTTIADIDETSVQAIRDDPRRSVRPGDGGYDALEPYNGTIDKRLGLIARCTGVADGSGALRSSRGWRWRCARAATTSPATRSATMGS